MAESSSRAVSLSGVHLNLTCNLPDFLPFSSWSSRIEDPESGCLKFGMSLIR